MGRQGVRRERPQYRVTLYYKALVAISDIIIYRKTGLVPSNHSERFRLMRREYP
ncbi:MAG: hypothetical protein QF415_10330 [Candidatus Undinarchaeales archaeon]|nr:hypothetical protein [Candidatus Undinarchaeales archaeon]MDP7494411.1 hypothetical protein [Candidatus Undinarchaeales archaeon]